MTKPLPTISEDVYTTVLSILPEQYADRQNVAAVAGWLASVGQNVSLIARMMHRSRPWVYRRIEAARRIFEPMRDL